MVSRIRRGSQGFYATVQALFKIGELGSSKRVRVLPKASSRLWFQCTCGRQLCLASKEIPPGNLLLMLIH